jgi:ABC-type transport system involved in Fe-S cluster assembly fused permease/ATPase subunit
LKKINLSSFIHLHKLDIYFHKISAKNTVFAINKAMKSIETALRFSLGQFAPVAFEFFLLSGTLFFYCGPAYMANMLITLGVYTVFSKNYSHFR